MPEYESDVPIPRSRITTDQRDRIIDRLSKSYAHDHIDGEEFERRVTEAQNVVTHEALLSLVADLPIVHEESNPAPRSDTRPDSEIGINSGEVRASESFVAILGGSDRRGPWRPARRSNAVAILGGVDLDFRDALIPPGVTEIEVFCFLGGVDIIVPPGVNVEMSGVPILGGFDNKAGSGDPGAPTLKITGFVLLGGVDVKVKQKKKRWGASS